MYKFTPFALANRVKLDPDLPSLDLVKKHNILYETSFAAGAGVFQPAYAYFWTSVMILLTFYSHSSCFVVAAGDARSTDARSL